MDTASMVQKSVYDIWGHKHPASECKKIKNDKAHQQSMSEITVLM
jgi:hypothetical protein